MSPEIARREEKVALMEDALAGDEVALILRAKDDRREFGALYDRYVEPVYHYLYRRTSSHPDAQDLTAETFRRALEALPRYEDTGRPFAAWLFGIAANVLREHARRRAVASADRALDEMEEPPGEEPTALDELVRQEEASALWRLVQGLPETMARVLTMRYAWNLEYEEIARRMRRSPAASKQLSYRALNELRGRAVALGLWAERGDQRKGDTSHATR